MNRAPWKAAWKYAFALMFALVLLQPEDEIRHEVSSPEQTALLAQGSAAASPVLAPIKPLAKPVRLTRLRQSGVMTAEAGRLLVEQAVTRALPDAVAAAQTRYQEVDKGRLLRATPKDAMAHDVPRALIAHDTVTLILTQKKSGEVIAFYRLKNGDAYLPPQEGSYGIITDRLSALTLYEYGEATVLFQSNTNDASALFFSES